MAIFYAPFGATVRDFDVIGHPMAWVLRVQWVKFMLCSGAVKVFSQGPTWRELTYTRAEALACRCRRGSFRLIRPPPLPSRVGRG